MSSAKILIVDDEPFNVDYLEQELEDLDYVTISAADGREALDLVQRESPDLLLLDIMMPVMDGFEVLAHLRADPVTRDLPVIVISANNDLRSVVRGIQLGADDYLPKPFEPTLLRARIAASLDKKRLRDLQQLYLKSLERELDIARDIQQSFLPAELPQVAGWEVAAWFKAAREVAGDFYDAFLLPDGNLACVIGDVCGKGVGAALFMTLFRSLIRAAATTDDFSNHKETPPVERLQHIVAFTNRYVVETHGESSMFATVFIGIFDLRSGTLTYINGGNEPPLLVKADGALIPLPPGGPALGIIPGATFIAREVALAPDDLLLAFTDGIPDALNAQNIAFGNARLLEVLRRGAATPSALLAHIAEAVHQFTGSADQFDDITLLAIKNVNK
jgi:serine phosphatase RsbU (regulator of sigma subunit)